MKKTFYTLLLTIFAFGSVFATPDRLLDIDFTRDSTEWKNQFPATEWNSGNTDLVVTVDNHAIGEFHFNGTFGKFNPGSGVMAQPIKTEKNNTKRRWAFRIDNTGTSFIEMPELSSVGRFTFFCKNGNASNEAVIYIQQKVGENWENIRTLYIPPHHNQNFEMQMEEFLNINSVVKLRIYGASKNVHIYEIRADAFDANLPAEKPLKLILIPDAQTYANQPDWTQVYGAMTMWINSIADSVKFVLQQGDMTQLNNDDQWTIAAGAYNLLEGRKIPFTYCAGNHDMGRHGNSRNTTDMNKYLPNSRYSRYDYYGGTFEPNTVDNTWHTFSRGNYKFLILSLEYLPRNKVIEWAKTVIEDHPKHNIIINTHSYLGSGDALNTGIPQDELNAIGDEAPNDGKRVWEKLVRQYSNCLFVFCGHVLGDGTGKLVSTGLQGNKVYQFIANYQGGVDGAQTDRNGMLRIVDLNPELGSFSIRTYSPYTKKDNTAMDQQYYYTNVKFIKDGDEPEPVVTEPSDILSEDFSTQKWQDELLRLNPGSVDGVLINTNAPNMNAYSTPSVSAAYENLNSTDLYFDKYKLFGAIESLSVLPCASVLDVDHQYNSVSVAFRLRNDAAGLIELPEVESAGTITIHVKNGNSVNPTTLDLEKFENNEWVKLHTFDLIPNGALRTSRDEVLSYDVNSKNPIKLRLRNSGTKYINLYRFSIGSYGNNTRVDAPKEEKFFISGRKLLTKNPSKVSVYNLLGMLKFQKQVDDEIELPKSLGSGVFIVCCNNSAQKIILN